MLEKIGTHYSTAHDQIPQERANVANHMQIVDLFVQHGANLETVGKTRYVQW